MELFHFVRLSICFYIKKDKSYKGVEDFLYVCCMKGFMRKIVVFLFATIFGLTSAIFCPQEAKMSL